MEKLQLQIERVDLRAQIVALSKLQLHIQQEIEHLNKQLKMVEETNEDQA